MDETNLAPVFVELEDGGEPWMYDKRHYQALWQNV